jgi:hypothetical protein
MGEQYISPKESFGNVIVFTFNIYGHGHKNTEEYALCINFISNKNSECHTTIHIRKNNNIRILKFKSGQYAPIVQIIFSVREFLIFGWQPAFKFNRLPQRAGEKYDCRL